MLTDEQIITAAIEDYEAGKTITDGAARVIAAGWHTGMTTALCSLATTGSIHENVFGEIVNELNLRTVDNNDKLELKALYAYCEKAGVRGPVDGWTNKWG